MGMGPWAMRSWSVGPLDHFHDEVVGADIVERADVGVIEGGDGSGFAFEALAEIGLGELDGDFAVEACVAGFVDNAHAAFADGGEDLVGADLVSGSEWHRD